MQKLIAPLFIKPIVEFPEVLGTTRKRNMQTEKALLQRGLMGVQGFLFLGIEGIAT